jgi:uncharacterized protein with NAD-binding domain and iron-sulfur cluster
MSHATTLPTDRPVRRKVAVIGGGLSGLTTAYELSRTPELRARYDVTIYQMGFRLGGKLASGRNRAHAMRNEEHGLHVWFGFYENAFRLAREVYERWEKPKGSPYQTVWDAFSPHAFTPMGPSTPDGGPLLLHFPRNSDVPGEGKVALSPSGMVAAHVDVVRALVKTLASQLGAQLPRFGSRFPRPVRAFLWPEPSSAPLPGHRALDRLVERALRMLDGLASPQRLTVDGAARAGRALAAVHKLVIAALEPLSSTTEAVHHLVCALDFYFAFFRGLLNPAYGIVRDWNLDRINHLEYREWLIANGARPETAHEWIGIRGLYDTAFQYLDGDPSRPSFEAGTAARIFIRMHSTYKNAVLFVVNGGMGEVMISPLYEVLRAQGVKFEFFHRLTRLELDADKQSVERLHFAEQARTVDGKAYEPLFDLDGMRCWPSRPDWSQLEDGCAMDAAGVDFESRFSTRAFEQPKTLSRGAAFDDVVLALPIACLARLHGEPSCVEELLIANPRVAAAAEGINLAPTVAAQLWVDKPLDALGWRWERPTMPAWAAPYSVWADMTPVLPHERWLGDKRPRSLHYLCGTFKTDAHRAPTTKNGARAAHAEAKRLLAHQLERHGAQLWPAARTARGDFDWSVLHDDAEREGTERLDGQYVKANIEPHDLCDGASVNTSHLRLEAHESGIDNLVFAGTWCRTGINSTCVEAATMSGLAAARAVAGDLRQIVGETFMASPLRFQPRKPPVEPPLEQSEADDDVPAPAPRRFSFGRIVGRATTKTKEHAA